MERYILQRSEEVGYWVVTDMKNGIICKFKEKEFNENQKINFLEDIKNPDPLQLARLMREMGDWLASNHYKIAMP